MPDSSNVVPVDQIPDELRSGPTVAVPAENLPDELRGGPQPTAPVDQTPRMMNMPGTDVAEGEKMASLPSGVVRPITKAAVGAISFPHDAIASLMNTPMGLKLLGGPPVPLMSDTWDSILDKYTTKPSTPQDKFTEWFNTMLVGGGQGLVTLGRTGARAAKQLYTRITSQAAQDAFAAGYGISPKYIGGGTSRTLQQISGGPKVSQEFSRGNQEVTDRLAKTAIGLEPTLNELEEPVLEALEQEAYAPYESLRTMGSVRGSQQLINDIDSAGGRFANRGPSFGGSRYDVIDREKAIYRKGERDQIDVGETLDEIRALRNASRQNLKQYNPEANALGYTQREIADALERHIEGAVQQPASLYRSQTGAQLAAMRGNYSSAVRPQLPANIVERLRASRIQLAKIALVRDSLGPGGHVRASDFARLLQSGYPLTEELRTIGMTARNFKDDMQLLTKGEGGEFSAIDFLLGGTGVLEGSPQLAGLVLARPITRAALRTETVQKSMLRGMRRRGREGSAVPSTTMGALTVQRPDSDDSDE